MYGTLCPAPDNALNLIAHLVKEPYIYIKSIMQNDWFTKHKPNFLWSGKGAFGWE
jgi:hypothetical protein